MDDKKLNGASIPRSVRVDPRQKKKEKLERRRIMADEYVRTLDWGKAAAAVATSKARAEDLYAKDKSFREMVTNRLTKKAESLKLSDDYVIKELMAIVRESRADKNHQAALKALELLGKHLKMFTDKTIPNNQSVSFNLNLGKGQESITLTNIVGDNPPNAVTNDTSSMLITIPVPEDKTQTKPVIEGEAKKHE